VSVKDNKQSDKPNAQAEAEAAEAQRAHDDETRADERERLRTEEREREQRESSVPATEVEQREQARADAEAESAPQQVGVKRELEVRAYAFSSLQEAYRGVRSAIGQVRNASADLEARGDIAAEPEGLAELEAALEEFRAKNSLPG
jgi:ribosomal protein RSM22 (predicted rRNA methylase)